MNLRLVLTDQLDVEELPAVGIRADEHAADERPELGWDHVGDARVDATMRTDRQWWPGPLWSLLCCCVFFFCHPTNAPVLLTASK